MEDYDNFKKVVIEYICCEDKKGVCSNNVVGCSKTDKKVLRCLRIRLESDY
jgi:hypothetical protein